LFVIGDGTADGDVNRSDIVRVNSGSAPGLGRVEVSGSLVVSGSDTNFEQLSGLRYNPIIVTSLPYTASQGDFVIAISASAVNGIGVELPASSYGKTYIVKDVSGSAAANPIHITAAGGTLIDGHVSASLSGLDYSSAQFIYFGTSIGWGLV
jgi:hypothetical protein